MSTVYAQTMTLGMKTQSLLYPETRRAQKINLLNSMRYNAEKQGLDTLSEKNLTWPPAYYYRIEGDLSIECSEDEAEFVIISVEAEYEDA